MCRLLFSLVALNCKEQFVFVNEKGPEVSSLSFLSIGVLAPCLP